MHIHGINVTLDFTGAKESSDHFGIEGVGRCFRAGNRVEITHLIHGFNEVVCFLQSFFRDAHTEVISSAFMKVGH